jgi:hypothetical protein
MFKTKTSSSQCFSTDVTYKICLCLIIQYRGGSRGGHPARAPPKIEKNMICLRKIVIFHTKYPKNFPRPPKIGKNMIFFA